MSPAEGSRWADLLMKVNPDLGTERIVRKNGKRNSAAIRHGRARRWMVRTVRWSAALLCAYVPLADRLPPLMPAPLLNGLALVVGLHAFLPLDGPSRSVQKREALFPTCRTGWARRVRRADTVYPVCGAGSPWAVARHRDRKRLDRSNRRAHNTGRTHGPLRPDRLLARASHRAMPPQPPADGRGPACEGCPRPHVSTESGERRRVHALHGRGGRPVRGCPSRAVRARRPGHQTRLAP